MSRLAGGTSTELSFYAPSVRCIAQAQQRGGEILWFAGSDSDPWDMIEAAMGLTVAGEYEAAERAFGWLAQMQQPDGSLWALYRGGEAVQERRESHHAAYLAVGLWQLWLASGNRRVLERYWDAAVRGLEFALSLQTEHGEMYWAIDADGSLCDDALVTACSNLCKSLECGIAGEELLGRDRPQWRQALQRLHRALRYSPHRFDRNWPSKRRYSMDWFYPVLCGVYRGEEGRAHMQSRWGEFVQPQLGCRCVVEEPWVTVAESSELVMALCALGAHKRARELFSWLHRHRDERGVYWTGYVWPDDAFWPEEKPSWTAGAVLLAADALYGFTAAARVLTHSQLPS